MCGGIYYTNSAHSKFFDIHSLEQELCRSSVTIELSNKLVHNQKQTSILTKQFRVKTRTLHHRPSASPKIYITAPAKYTPERGMMPEAGRGKETPELRTWPWISSVLPQLEEEEWIPPVPICTLSPHGRSAPECLSLLIPDKPEPPAQRGEGWMDRAKERRERGGGGQRPESERVGGIEEAMKTWGANKKKKKSETWDLCVCGRRASN